MKIVAVVGARPNFMKMAPFVEEAKNRGHDVVFIHTGQHYDEKMSKIFFEELKMPRIDYYLGIGGGTHAYQTGNIMIETEKILEKEKPDCVVVAGDVNSTMAVAITASKLHIDVVHVESGLRSYDRRMPEEINRIVTDRLSSLLLTPSYDANENLLREGFNEDRIRMVGNLMIDTLLKFVDIVEEKHTVKVPSHYALITIHRPSNVDRKEDLEEVFDILREVSRYVQLVFPMHPRTRKKIEEFGIKVPKNMIIMDPVGYIDFLYMMKHARFVITDSGGVQEETTVLKVPCLTMRENTERPITVELGTNKIVGRNKDLIKKYVLIIENKTWKEGEIPPLWDGKSAKRSVDAIEEFFSNV